MHVSVILVALALLMLVGALWIPNRDTQPATRRGQFMVAMVGLGALANLTHDEVLPVSIDLVHLAPVLSILVVILAVTIPAFRHPADRTKVSPAR